ncbi:MAG: hypothetical protein FJ213_10935 [Ignavibacteria bacterium]|nr:hypothetical protein [Ignavibacteria bacterium]
MSNFIPDCNWTFNHGPQKDYDFRSDWGTLTIQRDNLRYVRVTLNFCNYLDGWTSISKTYTPETSPTSEPFTISPSIYHGWCKKPPDCDYENYLNVRYRFNTSFFIQYGSNELIDEEYTYNSDEVSTNLRICKHDPFFREDINPGCIDYLPECEP